MDKKSVADALRLLAEDNEARTELAKLKEHLDSIDVALSAGVNRTKIYQTLCQCGLNMTKGSFLNALRKLMEDRNKPVQQIKKKQNIPIQESSDPQGEGSKNETVSDEDSGLTRRERGLKVAQKYINDEKMSPFTIRVLEKEKQRKKLLEKNDENNSD